MNEILIKKLIKEKSEIEPQNDILLNQTYIELLEIFKDNLNESINYLNTCSNVEFYWISELFEDLSGYFKSQELIDCMEQNSKRTGVDCSININYAKDALNY